MLMEGLRSHYHKQLGPLPESTDGILTVIRHEMKQEEKKMEFIQRKLKGTGQLGIVRFEQVNPLVLSLERFQMDEMSTHLLTSKDVFDALFYAHNQTNHQYPVIGCGRAVNNAIKNVSSFSAFYLSAKLTTIVTKRKEPVMTPSDVDIPPVRQELMDAFYAEVNRAVEGADGEERGDFAFYLDFNSLADLWKEGEATTYVENLFSEFTWRSLIQARDWMERRELNERFYLMESLHFQADALYGIRMNGGTIDDLLGKEVILPFERPTQAKPILINPRQLNGSKEDDLPSFSFLEAVMSRLLLLSVNKQGSLPTSGFQFPLKEREGEVTTLQRSIRLAADGKANIGIIRYEAQMVSCLNQRIEQVRRSYFSVYQTPLDLADDEVIAFLYARFRRIAEQWFENHPQDKERLIRAYHKDRWEEVAARLYQKAYKTPRLRVGDYASMIELLFVMNGLTTKSSSQWGRVSFLTYALKVNDLLSREVWEMEEAYYVLGSIAALASRDSRNRDALTKTFLGQQRVVDVMKTMNRRISSSVHEIKMAWIVKEGMARLTAHPFKDIKKTMNPDQRFAYIAGFLSENRPSTSPKREETP